MGNKWSIDECINILETAIGEVEHSIPNDVLEQTICYLTEYQNMKLEVSYDKYPDGFY